MSRLPLIVQELEQVTTISKLSGVFEAIASMQIAKTKSQVLASKDFFSQLWLLYTQLRVEEHDRIGVVAPTTDKQLFLVITAEGGFSGDIDQKLIEWMLEAYDAKTTDIIVIGHHGAVQLAQRGIKVTQYIKLPEKDEDIEVAPILEHVMKYPSTTAYYQTYVSLSVQDIKSLSLQTAVKNLQEEIDESNIISAGTYIFEPTEEEVINYLESTMLGVAISQVILESKLAQYASRFKAMTAANEKARESQKDLKLSFNRARRAVTDERLKEIINGLRAAGVR